MRSEIILIIHNGNIIPRENNEYLYDDWDKHDDVVVYDCHFKSDKPMKSLTPGDFKKHVTFESKIARRSQCIVITESNKKDYPEWFL